MREQLACSIRLIELGRAFRADSGRGSLPRAKALYAPSGLVNVFINQRDDEGKFFVTEEYLLIMQNENKTKNTAFGNRLTIDL